MGRAVQFAQGNCWKTCLRASLQSQIHLPAFISFCLSVLRLPGLHVTSSLPGQIVLNLDLSATASKVCQGVRSQPQAANNAAFHMVQAWWEPCSKLRPFTRGPS